MELIKPNQTLQIKDLIANIRVRDIFDSLYKITETISLIYSSLFLSCLIKRYSQRNTEINNYYELTLVIKRNYKLFQILKDIKEGNSASIYSIYKYPYSFIQNKMLLNYG
jgi:hypothetical protein